MILDVDVVYTWVNHEDDAWLKMYREASAAPMEIGSTHVTADNVARFQNRNELYYSIKSVKKYAPWVRHIYVVTNCQLTRGLAGEERIIRVGHEDIFPDPSVLPVFNSRAIEANLHRIPGLSENFLYFNDDFFLCKPVEKTDFFTLNGKAYLFPSKHDMPYAKTGTLSPFEHGALNACNLLIEDYGYKPVKRLHHAPYPLKRSTLYEIESRYENQIKETRTHKFRNNGDLPVATSLHAYYSLVNDYGEVREIASRYIDVGDPLFLLLVHSFSPLRRGKYMSCCINEITGIRFFSKLRDHLVERLMRKMFTK